MAKYKNVEEYKAIKRKKNFIKKAILLIMMIVVLSACSGEKDTVVKSGLNEEYVEDKQDYKYKASDLKTDKVEVVYVTSDAYGESRNIEVEPTLKAKEAGIIAGICLACSKTMGVYEENLASGLPMLDDMMGHAGIKNYINNGYQVISI